MVQNTTNVQLYDEEKLKEDLSALPDIYRFGMSGWFPSRYFLLLLLTLAARGAFFNRFNIPASETCRTSQLTNNAMCIRRV